MKATPVSDGKSDSENAKQIAVKQSAFLEEVFTRELRN
jgi:hypothetical protein